VQGKDSKKLHLSQAGKGKPKNGKKKKTTGRERDFYTGFEIHRNPLIRPTSKEVQKTYGDISRPNMEAIVKLNVDFQEGGIWWRWGDGK